MDSLTVQPRAASTGVGVLPSGDGFKEAARTSTSSGWTLRASNGVPFSSCAIGTLNMKEVRPGGRRWRQQR